MATTPTYGWETPDDTDLVKDGAAAIRTLGNAIDTTMGTMIPKTIVDAKGDIIAATAADTVTRLPVGTNGQALKANSATATGLEWGSVAATKNYSLLGTGTTTSGSTVTVSGISGIDSIRIHLLGTSSALADSLMQLRINGDTASNYVNVYVQIIANTTYAATFLSNTNATYDSIWVAQMNNAATDSVSGYIQIDGCNTSGLKMISTAASGNKVSGSGAVAFYNGGFWNNSSTVTSVSIVSGTGNFDAGSFKVYGAA